ncbi:MAG: uroporphyrinogen-III C-methyltransferase [Terriglobia bacterium]
MPAKVYLVGAGPGDPGLLTLKGRALLERAGCVIYDFLVSEELLRCVPADCEKVFAGKRAGRHVMTQDEINRLMIERSRAGTLVVRLKGGDPFIFGRGGEEAAALAQAGVPFEVVPGVSAGSSVPAYAGIPLTHRGLSSSVTFLTGHDDASGLESLKPEDAREARTGTLVFFMGARNLPEITAALIDQGRAACTPAAVIRWGTTSDQEVVTGTLADIASKAAGVHPPALAVVGDVVKLREQLQWFERLPLFGKRIVITRPREQSESFRQMLIERGAQPVDLPCIEIREPASWQPLDGAIGRLNEFNFLLVTSANGARNFMARLRACGLDSRSLKGIEIGAIGPATAAELVRHGVRADFVPREYRAEGLLEELGARELQGKSFLIPRARVARDLVPRVLRERGARVEVIEAYYVTAPDYRPDHLEALLSPAPHIVTFTSSSTATNFCRLPIPTEAQRKLAGATIASIGPVTSDTLRSLGLEVAIEARESTVTGLVAALEDYCRKKPGIS